MVALGLLIIVAAAAMVARYDPNDPMNALMLFIRENSLDRLGLMLRLREIGLLIFLYGVFMALRIH